MIAVLTAIVYIVSIVDETFNNKNVQKGTAISRIDTEDGYQVYKFIAYRPENDLMDADNTSCEVTQRLQQNKLYQISGKFAPLKDNSFNIIITTSIQLQMDEDNTPISKPVAHLIGNTTGYAEITNTGYTLPLQVKPYISKDQFQSYPIILTHPINGRLKNGLTKSKKNSLVHATGILFFLDKQLYCELLEFQFISARMDNDVGVTVPWKSANKTNNNSDIDQRISQIRQEQCARPPSPTNISNDVADKN
jgi:hypothetical protein